MSPKFGYLLPTRENIMEGRPAARPLVELATRAESLGYDSVWVGDSLLARPRHEPITLLSGVATVTERVELGTAVLLPALRNPVVLAHQIATLDQLSEGRFILGVGIAADVPSIHAEFTAADVPFEKRVGRMMEGLRLCRALWSGNPVDWDGRWVVSQGIIGPTPYRPGGPPIWMGSFVPAGMARAGRHFDGWFPTGPDAAGFRDGLAQVREAAAEAGRAPDEVTGAIYLTLAVDDDAARADRRINAYLESYYGQPAALLRKRQACFAGGVDGARDWIRSYVEAGAQHLVLRFAGEHERQLPMLAEVVADLR